MVNRLLFITALHGDEGFSIEVMKTIEKRLDPNKYDYEWIIGNPEAFKNKVRFTQSDLNRVAPGNETSELYEVRRAAELVKLSKNYSSIIDIHGTDANTGIFALVTNPTIENLFLASLIPVENIVIWASKESTVQGPITQHVSCPAVEIEVGPKNDESVQLQLEEVIAGTIERLRESCINILPNVSSKNYYSVYGKIENIDTTNMKEFELTTINSESFYPLLVNSYKMGSARKMRKVDFYQLFMY